MGADSLDLTEITMELEEKYKIKFDDKSYDSIKTVGDMISYIKKYSKGNEDETGVPDRI